MRDCLAPPSGRNNTRTTADVNELNQNPPRRHATDATINRADPNRSPRCAINPRTPNNRQADSNHSTARFPGRSNTPTTTGSIEPQNQNLPRRHVTSAQLPSVRGCPEITSTRNRRADLNRLPLLGRPQTRIPGPINPPASNSVRNAGQASRPTRNAASQTDTRTTEPPFVNRSPGTDTRINESRIQLQFWQDCFNDVQTPTALENALASFTGLARPPESRPNPDRTINMGRAPTQAEKSRQIQQLYRQNPKKAMEEVRLGETALCEISTEELHAHFSDVYSSRQAETTPVPSTVPRLPPPDTDDPLSATLNRDFVARCLSNTANSAPGPDRIRFAQWKKIDPDCIVITAIFNAVLRLKYKPRAWKESVTVMLYKKGPKRAVTNWRPIALSNTLGKLFASCTAKRLLNWITRNGRLSTAQKGFLHFEGCFEQNFTLQSIIQDARRRRRTAVVAWLDFRNAFGSVPHGTIEASLKWSGLGETSIDVIRMLYEGNTTRIRTKEGTTDAIPIKRGVIQGCPLSPVIFNLVMEPMLRAITAANLGYEIGGTKISALAYADDVALVSSSKEGLQQLLDIASSVAEWAGLSFNAEKCATLHVDGKKRCTRPSIFRIQGARMTAHRDGDKYRHLGVSTGYSYGPTGENIVEKMREDVEKIHESCLAPWQKADAVNKFVIPQLSFQLRGGMVARSLLNELDKLIKKCAKEWLNLPNRGSVEPLYIKHKDGGLNMLPVKLLADCSDVSHAVHLFHSKDPQITELAATMLRRVVKKRVGIEMTESSTEEYLNGSMAGPFAKSSSDYRSMWTRLRVSTTQLRKKINLRWQRTDEGAIQLFINDAICHKDNVEKLLRNAVHAYFLQRLQQKPDQGKVSKIASTSAVSNHYMQNGNYMRFADWRFVHRARLNVVPLRGCRRFGNGPKNCRKCEYPLESLAHVLNNCNVHKETMTKRHDAVLNRLLKATPKKSQTVYTNQAIPGCDSALRPDIMIINEKSKLASIIDVTIPFEGGANCFNDARKRKIDKYAGIELHFKEKGYKTFNNAFAIGALGSYDKANESCLKRLGIPHRYATLMKRLMVNDVIRWSRDIYTEHVTGIRQYAE